MDNLVSGINSHQLYYNFPQGLGIEKEESLVTRHRISEYLMTIKRKTIYRIERANNPKSKEIIIVLEIKKSDEMRGHYEQHNEKGWQLLKTILLPENKR